MTSPRIDEAQLAVVVVVFAGGDGLARTLAALEAQQDASAVRVIVAFAEGSVNRESLGDRFPRVRWVSAPRGSHPARLRALAVHEAIGCRVVACTEDHCTPAPDWCAKTVAAHAGAAPSVIGGAIVKETPASATSWAAYLLDYSRYLPPFDGADVHASDCNVSYPAQALARVRAAWDNEFHETVVHDALRGIGVGLRLDPSILVRQQRIVSLGSYLGERVEHGRLYASKRTTEASLMSRARWCAQSVLLPLVLSGRVLSRVRARPQSAQVPGAAWPVLAMTTLAWSWGEFLGYATGRER